MYILHRVKYLVIINVISYYSSKIHTLSSKIYIEQVYSEKGITHSWINDHPFVCSNHKNIKNVNRNAKL